MIEFKSEFRNKIHLTGVVQGAGYRCRDGYTMYRVNSPRPAEDKVDTFFIAIKELLCNSLGEFLKFSFCPGEAQPREGNIIKVKGCLCQMSFFSKEPVWHTCPVCGYKYLTGLKYINVLRAESAKILSSGDYHANLYRLKSGEWNNRIVLRDIPVTGTIPKNSRTEYLTPGYKMTFMSESLSENTGEMMIEKCKGHVTLDQPDTDNVFCPKCGQHTIIDHGDLPVVWLDKDAIGILK